MMFFTLRDSTIFSLALAFLGFLLKIQPQHGQRNPSHSIKTSQNEQRFSPDSYLPVSLCPDLFIL